DLPQKGIGAWRAERHEDPAGHPPAFAKSPMDARQQFPVEGRSLRRVAIYAVAAQGFQEQVDTLAGRVICAGKGALQSQAVINLPFEAVGPAGVGAHILPDKPLNGGAVAYRTEPG